MPRTPLHGPAPAASTPIAAPGTVQEIARPQVTHGDPPEPGRGTIGNDFDRITAYLGREYASMKRGNDITLAQLLGKLHVATRDNRSLRNDAAPLMALIAADIRAAKDFPVPGVPINPHRSMRTWRQRYNGLEIYLTKPA
ncbi:hypothetical protein E2F46_17170 [Luteimonas aestuarii]|uniref:Uncharacterized protein n=1 Tax=Luteimonas aestuarii TaxID=453837 RepID=A0A4R5TJX8_9GAMM|nr:hypothetical protein [Luteimonas aestuarii]TDK18849.1 hypothetical protein E2F46_17170 [Luteimonas aestuarii]